MTVSDAESVLHFDPHSPPERSAIADHILGHAQDAIEDPTPAHLEYADPSVYLPPQYYTHQYGDNSINDSNLGDPL